MKLLLYYPLRPYSVNQNFGDNSACVKDGNQPIAQRHIVSKRALIGTNNYACPLGYSELYPQLFMRGHTGIDLKAYHGQPLYHCGPESIVQEVQTEPERGLGLGLITKEKFDFEGQTSQAKLRYWHLKSFNVKMGDTVKLGDLIGWCDNTGLSAGDHLHLELKPVNQNGSSYSNIFQSNGYYGSVDPKPYFVGEYAQLNKKVSEVVLFNTDMRYGESNNEIKRLQKMLNELGYFTYPENTGNYREITRASVFNFQLDYVELSWWEKLYLKGKMCGPKTRAAINKIINK